jgi:hypothetical protein
MTLDEQLAAARARIHRMIDKRAYNFLHFKARSEGQRERRERERKQREGVTNERTE